MRATDMPTTDADRIVVDWSALRGLAAVVALFAAFVAGVYAGDAAPSPAPVVHEGDAGWDCHTMGNRVCGPTGL